MAIIKTIVLMNYDVVVEGNFSITPCIELGTKDSYGTEKVRVIFGEGWSGLEALAVFHAPGGSATKKTVGADGILEVPPEATADNAGRGKIVFLGLADGLQRITVDLPYSIRDHSGIDGDNPGTPTPDVVQQILENSNNAVRVAQAAKDAAENAHRAAEDAAIKAGEEAGGAAASAAAAAASADTANAAKNAAAAAATAAGKSQNAASQSEARAATSAAAAAKDANSIGEAAAKATQEAGAAAGSATAAKESAAAAAASATKAGQSAGTATEKASAAESARAAAESASASASASAKSAADAAKTAGDAATKVINEGVAEKLTEMQGIQEDVKARQQDVTEKQADVTANVELARQAALSNGYMQMGVDPDTGHLMYTRTTNLKDKLDFAIVNGTNLEVQIHG